MARCSIPRLFVAVVVTFSVFFFFIVYLDLLPEHSDSDPPKEAFHDPKNEDVSSILNSEKKKENVFLPPEPHTNLPIIVWWTKFVPTQRRKRKCPKGTCLVTLSRTELTNPVNEVSAFIYYGSDFDLNDLPLPRKPQHMWALLHEESPKNNWLMAIDHGISLFNITSTFSRYSHYPLHLHYLHTFKKHLLQPIRTPASLKSKNGLAPVVYMQTACGAPSARDSYVRNLMKYISVDSYGGCLHNKNLPNHLVNPLTFGSEEILDLVGKYKFVLSFENAVCHDYFTEKFWRPLYAGSVPVVRGSPTIRDWDPSGNHPSMILADDFQSPKDLADFLLSLDKNDEDYERYLSFKRDGVTNKRLLDHYHAREWGVDGELEAGETEERMNFIDGFECFVCDTLHERRKSHDNSMMVANNSHFQCLSPRSWVKHSDLNSEERDNLNVWTSTEKSAKKTAKVVVDLIGQGADQKRLNEALKYEIYMIV